MSFSRPKPGGPIAFDTPPVKDTFITVLQKTKYVSIYDSQEQMLGAQWLNGRVLNSRPKGRGFEPHRRHCAICLFVCFVALRPKSTAMVIAGRSVHLTTLFSWASLNMQLTSNRAHTIACN